MELSVRNYHRLTRVDWSTLQRRGKSFTPSSRISIEDSSNCREARREETEADSADAIVNAEFILLNWVFECLLSLPIALLDTRDVSLAQTVTTSVYHVTRRQKDPKLQLQPQCINSQARRQVIAIPLAQLRKERRSAFTLFSQDASSPKKVPGPRWFVPPR